MNNRRKQLSTDKNRCERSEHLNRSRFPVHRSSSARRRRGFILTLTLIVLVLIVGILVHFQIESRRHVRTSRHRVNQLKCRYASESAIIAATQIVTNVVENPDLAEKPMNWSDFKTLLEDADITLSQDMLDQLGVDDPCQLKENLGLGASGNDLIPGLGGDDPCSLFTREDDPCAWEDPFLFLDDEEYEGEKVDYSPNIFHRQTLEVGEVEVDVIIYDENSKFPLVWVLQSPIYKDNKSGIDALKQMGRGLNVSTDVIDKALKLTQEIGKPLNVPKPPYYYYKLTRRRGRETTTWWRKRSSRELYHPRGREHPSRSQYVYYELLQQVMTDFAELWIDRTKGDDYRDLKNRIEGLPVNFSDYLGYWGNTTININTAPLEVLHATLSPFGLTREMAEKIIELRTTARIKNINELSQIEGIDNAALYAIREIARTGSNTFSVHVIASLGKARYALKGAIYIDRRNNAELEAIFPGD